MKKCKDCGEEFPNVNALTQHKKTCPVLVAKQPPIPMQMQGGEQPNPEGFIIPLELCPDEIKYYAQGKVLGLRLTGKLVDTGVLLQEVTLIR